MKIKTSKYLYICLILFSLSILVTSCKKTEEKPIETDSVEVTKIEPKVAEPKIQEEPTKPIEEVIDEPPVVEEKLDISKFGFSLEDNCLYLNGTILSARKIANYSITKDNAKFNLEDGTVFKIYDNGNFDATFPIGIKISTDYQLTSFETRLNDRVITKNIITRFSTYDDWYSIEYVNGVTVKFDSKKFEAKIDKISIQNEDNKNITKYGDAVISTTRITNTTIDNENLKIKYDDGSNLDHIEKGLTTYTLSSGIEFTTDSNRTTIKTHDKIYYLEGEFIAAKIADNGDIIISTKTDNMSIDKETLNVTPYEEKKEEPIVEEPVEEPVVEEAPVQEVQVSTPVAPAAPAKIEDNDYTAPIQVQIDMPYRLGLIANATWLRKPQDVGPYGFRLDGIIERRFTEELSVGFQIGVGADKTQTSGFYKESSVLFTFMQEFFLSDKKDSSLFYTIGVGSMIPILEQGETPFFRLKTGLGYNYNFGQNWQFRIGFNYNFMVRSNEAPSHGFDIPIGILYRY